MYLVSYAKKIFIAAASALSLIIVAGGAYADLPQPVAKGEFSSEEDIRAALFGGVPGDRWKEGLLFEGIKPSPWMASASNWFPRTEDVQPNEMRIILWVVPLSFVRGR